MMGIRSMTKKYINVPAGCLLAMLAMTVGQSLAPSISWFGLGEGACFGQTCLAGQFCSDSPLFQRCRDCEDIKIWCSTDPEHLAKAFPSCFHVCPGKELQVRPSTQEDQKGYSEGTAGWQHAWTAVGSAVLIGVVVAAVYFSYRRYKRGASQRQTARKDAGKPDEETWDTCLLPPRNPSAPPSDSEMHTPLCDAAEVVQVEQEVPRDQVLCNHSHALAASVVLELSVPAQVTSDPANPTDGAHSVGTNQLVPSGCSAHVSPGSADRDEVRANVHPDPRATDGLCVHVTLSSDHVTAPQLLPLCHPEGDLQFVGEPQFVMSHLHV